MSSKSSSPLLRRSKRGLLHLVFSRMGVILLLVLLQAGLLVSLCY